jgi:hypothetical protein
VISGVKRLVKRNQNSLIGKEKEATIYANISLLADLPESAHDQYTKETDLQPYHISQLEHALTLCPNPNRSC